jgi:hypothetical protein
MPAKVDRMVNHIIASEMANGKSREEATRIAWATVNKRKSEKKVKKMP